MESVELVKLQEMVDTILKKLDSFQIPRIPEPTYSQSHDELFAALAKAQGAMATAYARRQNSYYKSPYTDLSILIETARKPLSDNNLSVIQRVIIQDGLQILQTVLGHSSGQWISSQIPITPPQNDVETLGSYLAVLKRHAYSSIVGIASNEEDDDGEISMHEERKKVSRPPVNKLKMERESYETISNEQREELEYELERHPNPEEVVESIYKAYRINNLAGIPKSKFLTVITKIREVIHAEKEATKHT